MNISTLKLCSYYKYRETGSSCHRWLLWVLLALLLTKPTRDSRDHGRPWDPPAMCPQVVCREKCVTAACWQPARSSQQQINCLNFVAALCQAASFAHFCPGCTRDPVPTVPARLVSEQVGFGEWPWLSNVSSTDSAVFPGRKIGL